MADPNRETMLLVQLVSMFHAAALQKMGKLKNPATDAIERNLEEAQLSIDMLDMLKRRMAGNLTAEETRLLDGALQELKLNFVDELAKDQAARQTGEKAKQ